MVVDGSSETSASSGDAPARALGKVERRQPEATSRDSQDVLSARIKSLELELNAEKAQRQAELKRVEARTTEQIERALAQMESMVQRYQGVEEALQSLCRRVDDNLSKGGAELGEAALGSLLRCGNDALMRTAEKAAKQEVAGHFARLPSPGRTAALSAPAATAVVMLPSPMLSPRGIDRQVSKPAIFAWSQARPSPSRRTSSPSPRAMSVTRILKVDERNSPQRGSRASSPPAITVRSVTVVPGPPSQVVVPSLAARALEGMSSAVSTQSPAPPPSLPSTPSLAARAMELNKESNDSSALVSSPASVDAALDGDWKRILVRQAEMPLARTFGSGVGIARVQPTRPNIGVVPSQVLQPQSTPNFTGVS